MRLRPPPPHAVSGMDGMDGIDGWRDHGFAVLPAHLSDSDLRAALGELPAMFPTADEFHDEVDPDRNERFSDEFGGITDFPFLSTELSLLAVHERLIDLAERLLATTDLRVIG